jgi:ADP-heptose:LPS heptosyltransferase
LLGAPNDAAAGSVVEGGLPPDRVVNLVGKTSLAQAIATIRDAEFVVANDSALVHIAAACGVAAISTLGGGHPDRFLPYPPSVTWFRPPVVAQYRMDCYGCAWNCIYPIGPDAPAPCIAGITIAQVEQACHTVLGAPA